MSACIFIGPSLPRADALALYPQCRFLPPVQHGAIFNALRQWPLSTIGIIDGYFQHRPSVWHKEILWALDQGVYVAGASSMGALRAAELAAFGMVGIGKVFNAFEQGAMPPFCGLDDDDEVAIVHGPAESGYVVVSEAMINIRHTLDAACAANIIDAKTAGILVDEAKSLHFADRTYAKILDQTRRQGVSRNRLEHFANWLPAGKVDQKRADAIELIKHLASMQGSALRQVEKRFYFETTEIFHDALHDATETSQYDSVPSEHDRNVLDELRLNEEAYANAKFMAVVKCLLTEKLAPLMQVAEDSKSRRADQQLKQIIDDFRRDRGLLDRVQIDEWLAENDLKLSELEDLLLNNAQIGLTMTLPDVPPISGELINQLKLTGLYAQHARRATRKRDMLKSQQRAVHQPPQLLNWYFKTIRGRAVPADLVSYAQQHGLTGEAELLELLVREYHFLDLSAG